ncbi:MAG: hypothetical protein HDR87_09970 [Bacteroides sp.]|nr:hypothetical protein [Bacteroides sp.]
MIQYKVVTFLMFLAAMLCGCQKSQVSQQLDLAEAMMEERPDSALAILREIDGSALSGEPQARHALLLSQAYGKNKIFVTNDSLISIALSYYQDSGDNYHRMLAHHYFGATHLYAEDYTPAFEHVLEAYDIATELKDTLNLSRTASNIAVLFSMNYDDIESLKWHCLSLELAKRCEGKDAWIKNAYENIGEELIQLGRHQEAIQYADSAISLSLQQNPRAEEIKYMSYFNIGEYQKADSIFEILSRLDYEMSPNIKEGQVLNNPESQQEIIDYYSSVITEQNELIFKMSRANMASVFQRHEAAKTQQLNLKLQNSRRLLTVSAIGIILLIILIILLIRNHRLSESKNILEKESQIYALRKEYEALKEIDSRNSEYIQDLNSNINQLKQRASAAFLNQFAWIEHIGNVFIDAELSAKVNHKRVIEQIRTRLQFNSPQELTSNIEQSIAESDETLWKELNQIDLKDIEKAVVYLSIINVSTRVISLIIGKSPSAIYNIKSRAKAKLKSVDSPIINKILDNF